MRLLFQGQDLAGTAARLSITITITIIIIIIIIVTTMTITMTITMPITITITRLSDPAEVGVVQAVDHREEVRARVAAGASYPDTYTCAHLSPRPPSCT